MRRDVQWAARYQFLEDLWRGRARVLADARLEHALATEGPGFGRDDPAPLCALAQALVPERPGGAPAWCTVAQVDPEGMQRRRPGTHFVTPAALAPLLARRPWDVAVVDVARLEGEAGEELQAVLRRGLADGRRAVVLLAPGPTADGPDYDELVARAAGLSSVDHPARIYGLFDEQVFGIVEYGEPLAGPVGEDEAPYTGADDEGDESNEGDEDDDAGADDEDDEDVPLAYDNVLGVEDPAVREWIVVVTGEGTPFAAEGLTLVEVFAPAVPAADGGASPAADRRELEAQLEQARRRADLAEIQRRQLLERQNDLRRENARLLETLDALRQREAAAGAAEAEAAAREQELRLRVEQLEAELRRLRPRPVSELEAEVASLRARLAEREADRETVDTPSVEAPEMPAAAPARPAVAPGPPRPPARVRVQRVVPGVERRLAALLARLERDPALRATEVRRALLALRARLRRGSG